MASEVPKLKKKLWELCKRLTRAKYGNTCYTCGAKDLAGSNWHTAHFIPKSICSTELAFDLDNLKPCCYRCNINLSGNWVAYEEHLIADHGESFVAELKERNRKTNGGSYGAFWYKAKIAEYEEMLSTAVT